MRSLREFIVHFLMFTHASIGTRLALICNMLETYEKVDIDEIGCLIADCEASMSDLIDCFEFLENRLMEGKSLDVLISLKELARSAEDLPFKFDREIDLN